MLQGHAKRLAWIVALCLVSFLFVISRLDSSSTLPDELPKPAATWVFGTGRKLDAVQAAKHPKKLPPRPTYPGADPPSSKSHPLGSKLIKALEEEERRESIVHKVPVLPESERAALLQSPARTSSPPPRSNPSAPSRCEKKMGKVGIFIIFTNPGQYQHSMNIMRCYAISRGYEFYIVNPFTDERSVKACAGINDVMFRKHCAAAEYLSEVEWLMVTDADTAVMNADRCIEDFLDPDAEMLFYERFFSSEIMSGSYIARNTPAAKRMMREWAAIEHEKPPDEYFFSADNGAIHLQVLRLLYPERAALHQYCMSLLRLSKWPEWEIGYGLFLRCAKRHMLEFSLQGLNLTKEPLPFARVRLLPRAQSWCRDAGFSFYHYYSGDFMSHNVKDAEPFDPTWVEGLKGFWDPVPKIPKECKDPHWAPKLDPTKSALVSQDQMRDELASAGTYFGQNEKLRPLFAKLDIAPCWPHCPDVFRTF